jgi:tripartite-type tricarboxylate transporter receptor subunit TctC
MFEKPITIPAQMYQYLELIVFGLGALTISPCAMGQPYPNKPVRMMVGYAAGGGADTVARLIANKITIHLGQSMLVENRPGATGGIAADYVSKSEPDGYRILMTTSGTVVHSILSTGRPYDIGRDFTPIAMVSASPLILLVNPSLPVKNVTELIELARSKPGQLTFGSDGLGGAMHLAGELFNTMAKVKMLHVPFKGSSDGVVALAGGQIDVLFPSIPPALPLVKMGKLRALAVTSTTRALALPTIPTIDESAITGFDYVVWYGIFGPTGMPRAIVDKLNEAIVKVVGDPDVKESMSAQSMVIKTDTPETFSKYLRDSSAQIYLLSKQANLKLD